MTARLMALVAAVFVVAMLAGGCGGDDDPSGSGSAESAAGTAEGSGDNQAITTSSLDKEEFVKQANAACQRQSKDYTAEVTRFLEGAGVKGMAENEVALVAMKQIVVPITEAQIAAIRKLGAPEGDEEEVAAALAAQEQAIENVVAAKQIRSGADLERYVGDATEMLQDYGLRNCVFSP